MAEFQVNHEPPIVEYTRSRYLFFSGAALFYLSVLCDTISFFARLFQRAYSLPVRTQTPSSQNRINLRRSVRGEPPPHPARLRKHRHGWTLHLAHPLEASGCTRSLVVLLVALLVLLGIGALALYIALGKCTRRAVAAAKDPSGRVINYQPRAIDAEVSFDRAKQLQQRDEFNRWVTQKRPSKWKVE